MLIYIQNRYIEGITLVNIEKNVGERVNLY